jgi:membrane glycosyltransferase
MFMKTLHLEPTRPWLMLRRWGFALLVTVTVISIGGYAFRMLRVNGLGPVKLASFTLFAILLVPIALSFWTALIGFVVQWRGGDTLDLGRTLDAGSPAAGPLPRTAIVMPVYNEDPARVFAGLKASYLSLEHTGLLNRFDFFVLSDTTEPDTWISEELAFAELRQEVNDAERLVYRNRRQNTERKTGNIADFCATWGDQYRYMVVFDADSIMTGVSLINLVRLMEANPQVGIVQAPPLPINRRSLFGRIHQFAMQAYSLIFITGLNFWQGGAANYWGHNAIIRIEPFVRHCRLPKLPGKEPLGGAILSHDFVEAAFMRRAGWKVYLASELRGSYEEMPSSLIGYAARDRRWCQGNLQHARLLFTPGFHTVNRVHILMGLMSYLASPLWLLLLVLTTIEGIREKVGPHEYFPHARSLFPDWHISVRHQAIILFTVMMGLLLLPKLLSLLIHWRNSERSRAFGGPLKLTQSVVCETLASTLLAPNLALLQTRFVIGILLGRKVEWKAQDRGETGTSLCEAFARHWPSMLLGALWTALLAFTVPTLLGWFSPVIAGFLLAVPISALSSRPSWGDWARRHRLFLTPEELEPPDLLRSFDRELAARADRAWLGNTTGLDRVLNDPHAWEVHLSFLPTPTGPPDPLHENHLERLRLKVLHEGAHTLNAREKRDLLLDARALLALREATRSSPHNLALIQTPNGVPSEVAAQLRHGAQSPWPVG